MNRGAIIEDPDLGRKLAAELGEIAGWALSMDKAERDRILLVPSTNLAIVALKQEGAILGDSVRGSVDRCFRPGGNNYVGADLHSWYVAYCKAHNNTPQGYNKFVHHLQRVLSKQWRASTVVREGDKIKRIPAFWGGLQVLPCFIDSLEFRLSRSKSALAQRLANIHQERQRSLATSYEVHHEIDTSDC